ncbi:MAG: PRC and DUF2382 domain-containing protein [Nocardioidaceae bacterium]
MLTAEQAQDTIGRDAVTDDGDKLGKVGQVFLDDETGEPAFVTVNTGLFGTNETFVPLGSARVEGDTLAVPFSKDQVKDAPNVDISGGHMSRDEEKRLYEYYGLNHTQDGAAQDGWRDDDATVVEESASTGHDTSGPNTDDAVTRSEERLDVGTTTEETGRVRLRKYVTTEQETYTVPVRTERAVLEREPVTEANVDQATSGADISEEEHEVVLSQERVTVDKTVEPVERVSLGTETVTEDQTVTEDVRKEQIEVDGDVDDRRS